MNNTHSPRRLSRVMGLVIVTAALLAGGLLAGYGVGKLLGATAPDRPVGPGPVLVPVALPFGLILLVHELGHVLAGKLVGFRFLLLIVGLLKVTGGRQGLHFGLNRNLALAGGLAACLPTDQHNLNRRLLVMTAGGPVASVLLGAAGLWLHQQVGGQAPWDLMALTLGLGSLAIAVVTLIPMTTAGFLTDGAQILSLWRNDETARLRAWLLALQAESMAGARPRDWSQDVLAQTLAGAGDPAMQGMAQMMGYYVALDRGEFEAAGRHLAQTLALVERLPSSISAATFLEAAYFEAAHRRNATTARHYLNKGGNSLAERHSQLRAEAAVLLAEGDERAGRAKAAEAIRLAARSFDRGSAEAEQAWIERDLLAPG